jgi:hypothetical protein
MAEYAYYHAKYTSTKISPFSANYGFEPRTTWPTEIQFQNPASEMYGHYMSDVHWKLKEQLAESLELMKKHYNKKRKAIEPLEKGELVMLSGRNNRAKHRGKKLDDKMLGPFEVILVGSNGRFCKLRLLDHRKLHLVFDIDFLERYRGTNRKKHIRQIEVDGEEWVMESIIASGPSDDNPKHHVLLVHWKDFAQIENSSETHENVAGHNMELLQDYYKKNPAMEKDGRFGLEKKKKLRRKKTS